MFDLYRQRLISFCMFAAIVCSCFYFREVYIDFMISLAYHTKFNVPSIAYTILRVVTPLFPLILLTPFSKNIPRITRLRVMLIIIGICYLLGNTWIFYHLAFFPFETLFDIRYLQEFQYNNALALNYLIWNSHTVWGILFSTVEAILYFILAKKFYGPRKKALLLYGITLALLIVIPIVYTIFDPTRSIFEWAQKNALILLSQFLTYAAFCLLGNSRDDWEEFLWSC